MVAFLPQRLSLVKVEAIFLCHYFLQLFKMHLMIQPRYFCVIISHKLFKIHLMIQPRYLTLWPDLGLVIKAMS